MAALDIKAAFHIGRLREFLIKLKSVGFTRKPYQQEICFIQSACWRLSLPQYITAGHPQSNAQYLIIFNYFINNLPSIIQSGRMFTDGSKTFNSFPKSSVNAVLACMKQHLENIF